MRIRPPVPFLVLLACAAGCAKPMTPIASDANGTIRSAMGADRSSAAGREGSYRVRLTFVGNDVRLGPNFQPIVDRRARFYVFPRGGGAPIDTVPAYSRLTKIEWRRLTPQSERVAIGRGFSAPSIESTWIADESAARDTAPAFAPGFHQLVLTAPPRAGGGTVTVVLFCGFRPSVWWAGPDPALFPPLAGGGRGATVTNWNGLITVPPWPADDRGYFAPDSLVYPPSRRRPVGGDFERRTFYELFENRVYARSEGDTVHFGSWVALVNGGYDRDSPYTPLVEPGDPALPPGFPGDQSQYPVLLPQGLIGSPIGFRIRLAVRLTNGLVAHFVQSPTFPDFRPSSYSRLPQVSGYLFMRDAGKVYVAARAIDSQGLLGPGGFDEVQVADLVDAGGGTPEQRQYRRAILTFFVGPPPPGADARSGGTSGSGDLSLGANLRR